jgi:hypothetical protein
MTLYFEPFNDSATRYVLLPELPTVGSIFGMIEVEGEFDSAWTGKENCVFYEDGTITFIENANYTDNRVATYPSTAEQLDMLYHDIKAGTLETGDWITAIEAVKTANPKP